MKAIVKWTDGAMFVGESGSGHTVVMDGPEDLGGRNLAARPMEMLLLGTGGCSIYDVLTMLKKSRQQVVDCRVELDAQRADQAMDYQAQLWFTQEHGLVSSATHSFSSELWVRAGHEWGCHSTSPWRAFSWRGV